MTHAAQMQQELRWFERNLPRACGGQCWVNPRYRDLAHYEQHHLWLLVCWQSVGKRTWIKGRDRRREGEEEGLEQKEKNKTHTNREKKKFLEISSFIVQTSVKVLVEDSDTFMSGIWHPVKQVFTILCRKFTLKHLRLADWWKGPDSGGTFLITDFAESWSMLTCPIE